jgi:hypothetical protein
MITPQTQKEATRRIGKNLANKLTQSCGLLFLALGILKLHSILFPDVLAGEFLGFSNPIFIVANRNVLGISTILEIGVGVIALKGGKSLFVRSGLLLWLACSALAYKFALALVHYQGPCGCLLGINRFLPIPISTQNWLSDIILLVTILISLCILIYARLSNETRTSKNA